MPFLQTIKTSIGDEVFARLEAQAEKEVALAMKMELVDEYHQEKYNRPFQKLQANLVEENRIFEDAGLRITPLDVVNILFRCKLLFASKNEGEYSQRIGGGSYPDQFRFLAKWSEKQEDVGVVIDRYFDRLESMLESQILISEINDLHDSPDQQAFFDDLFTELEMPFECFFDDVKTLKSHQEMEPGLEAYNINDSKEFCCSPSIAFRVFGSETYTRYRAQAYLRTFLNLLRVSGFVAAPQLDKWGGVKLTAPTAPVLRGQPPYRSMEVCGCFCWDEDKKESWEKIPDGYLSLSFGYRGLSNMWIDSRSFAGIKMFIIDHKIILDELRNPWNPHVINDLMPTMDILSSATQIPDTGAKILLLYCCLEHLFVPKETQSENKKYIVGGLQALNPKLKPWFDELYELRCNYAHKGFILRNEKTMGIIMQSMRNITSLLVAKLNAVR